MKDDPFKRLAKGAAIATARTIQRLEAMPRPYKWETVPDIMASRMLDQLNDIIEEHRLLRGDMLDNPKFLANVRGDPSDQWVQFNCSLYVVRFYLNGTGGPLIIGKRGRRIARPIEPTEIKATKMKPRPNWRELAHSPA